MSTLSKLQHYVWQGYLRAWEDNGKIHCYRQNEKKLFKTGTKTVAGETFFYRAHRLSSEDLRFIEITIEQAASKSLQDIHRRTVRIFQLTFKIRDHLEKVTVSEARKTEVKKTLENLEKSIGERFHGYVEGLMIPILKQLKEEDDSFYGDQRKILNFLNFLSHQFFRTPKLRLLSARKPSVVDGLDLDRIWLIQSHIFAVNIAAGLYNERENHRIIFLKNETNVPFITSDQPVINLNTQHDKDLRLYYPISPGMAIILTKDHELYVGRRREVTTLEAEHYNHEIYRNSVDQLYSNNSDYLSKLVKIDKKFS